MKNAILICLALMATAFGRAATPERKPANEPVTTVFLTDIRCGHCKEKIMGNIPVLGKGIKEVSVDVPTKRVSVTYDASKNNDATIVKGFAKLKVKADPLKEKE